jgi:16S rRNA (guanine966-N2)-methyltransferase
MRIVAGAQRGRSLVAPKGHSTRPTADRTRQALFNVLEHAAWTPGVEDARVVDLFAGSGALGLESVSRGAAFCLFVDSDPAALAAVTDNIDSLRLEARCATWRLDASRLPALAGDTRPFDLAFLDPPYARGLTEPALASLAARGWLRPNALAVVERGVGEGEFAPSGFEVIDSRAWGAARVWFLRLA